MKKIFLILGALIGWFAVGLQFYLILLNRTASILETIARFFTFFTILTNILVAFYFTILLLRKNTRLYTFVSLSKVSTAITLYITVVGLVYQFILRPLWDPKGLQYLADELLHSVTPFYVILYWSIFANKTQLEWKQILSWLIYPICYFVVIIFRGAFSGYYPYPFVNVNELGYPNVLLNSGVLVLLFALLSVLFILVAKLSSRK